MSRSSSDVIKEAGEAERTGNIPRAESLLRKALSNSDGQCELNNALGGLLGRQGHFVEAQQAFEQALAADSSSVAARFNLGSVFVARGDYQEAASYFEHALRLQPNHAGCLLSLGSVCNSVGDYEQAAENYRKFLAVQPGFAPAWVYLGASYQFLSNFDSARECYERALELDPQLADAHCNLGKLYQSEGNHRMADKYLRRTLEIVPDHPVALGGLATLLERSGDYADGKSLLQTAMQSTPSSEIVVAYASLCRRLNQPGDAEPLLREALNQPGLGRDGEVQLHFSLGRVYDVLGEYDKAFDHFRMGNDLNPFSYDCANLVSAVDAVIGTFEKGFSDRLSKSGLDSELPVFIVGMPRTGKSLLEQMLSVHPDITALGELTEIGNISTELRTPDGRSYPDCLFGLNAETMISLANRYLGKLPGGAMRCTDTLPGNFIHLGLIELLFGEARVIHMQRDVLDTCLSCYFKNFAGLSLGYTFDLHNVGTYYCEYKRLMRHWREVSNLEILDISYESLINDTELTLAQTLEFLGLEYHRGCLDFHKYDPGSVQRVAHEPLHARDVGMHRNYLPYLEPLKQALGSQIDTNRTDT